MKKKLIYCLEKSLRLLKDWLLYRKYSRQFRSYNKMHRIEEKTKNGEEDYVRLWSPLSKRVERHSYRLFSCYCGNTSSIVPENIGRRFVEPILNPHEYKPYYEDKNMYSQFIDDSVMPRTLLRRIGGGLIKDSRYKIIPPPIKLIDTIE